MSDRLKIVFVDDELVILKALELVFGDSNDILTANGATEALQLLDKHSDVDVMVSDLRMPDTDGLQLLKEVKRRRPEIHCYLLSGFAMTPKISKYIEQGIIVRLIHKPVELNVLLDTILKDLESSS